MKANNDVYVAMMWRRGKGGRVSLYKYVSPVFIHCAGKQTCVRFCKRGDELPANLSKNTLEYRAAVNGTFTLSGN